MRAGYALVCLACEREEVVSEYVGETGRNPFTRSQEHLKLLQNKSKVSVLWKHCLEFHDGQTQEFKMEVRTRSSTPLERQAMEGVKIKNFTGDNLMNSKAEWRGPKIARTSYSMDFLPE